MTAKELEPFIHLIDNGVTLSNNEEIAETLNIFVTLLKTYKKNPPLRSLQ